MKTRLHVRRSGTGLIAGLAQAVFFQEHPEFNSEWAWRGWCRQAGPLDREKARLAPGPQAESAEKPVLPSPTRTLCRRPKRSLRIANHQ